MDNQHKMIKGYRDLSAEEIALMNEIKAIAVIVGKLVENVDTALNAQWEEAYEYDTVEHTRLMEVQPFVWLQRAKDDLQTGFMKLTRAVAQPTTF
jgi:hypothetical protein